VCGAKNMKGYKLAKVPEDMESKLEYIVKLTNKPESVVLGMCLNIVNAYFDDNQILMESKVHCPKDKRRKENR
jgi:hypothetical protein